MACGLDKIDAGVDTRIDNLLSINSAFLVQISVKPVLEDKPSFDIVQDGLPAVMVVDEITKTGGIDARQPQFDAVLFEFCRHALDFNCFWCFGRQLLLLLGGVQRGAKQRVDKRALAQTGFAHNHQREIKALLDALAVELVGQIVEANVSREFERLRCCFHRKATHPRISPFSQI